MQQMNKDSEGLVVFFFFFFIRGVQDDLYRRPMRCSAGCSMHMLSLSQNFLMCQNQKLKP